MNLIYGSVCSGIEAATVAWHSLGWRASWFAEVDAFPSAVLAHHYPDVPNHGDMRWLPLQVSLGDIDAPDVLVGGTPCQSFSLAGLRKGISDERGQLTLKYVELANEIDERRVAAGRPECIIVWENVPGVLSSKDNAFGCFLAALSGASEPLTPEGAARWPNSGVVFGPQRAIAWRTLDAQYFGLAQRRKRVFVVASARTDFHPAQVLLESYGMRGNTAPRREAGKELAGTITARFGRNGGAAKDDIDGGRVVTHALRGEGFDASEDGTGRGTPLVTIGFHHNAQAAQLPTSSRNTAISDTLSCSQQAAVAYSVCLGSDPIHARELAQPITLRNGDPGTITQHMKVRRLTPRECERLQGFPDDYTLVPFRKKPAADGNRYKSLGNSMATPCMRWIGERIEYAIRHSWMNPEEWL